MASFNFTIADDDVSRVVDGFAYQYKYQDNIDDPENPGFTIPNPESKTAHAKRRVREFITQTVKAAESKQAAEAARATALNAANPDVNEAQEQK